MRSSGTGRLLRWRVATIVGQLAVASGYAASAFETPFMALMALPPLAIVAWCTHGVARRRPEQLSRDQLLTEFGLARGLALGTACWVLLSVAGVILGMR